MFLELSFHIKLEHGCYAFHFPVSNCCLHKVLISISLQFKRFTHGMKDGWGLATDGKVIFGTDGSSSLYQMNPRTMKGLYD